MKTLTLTDAARRIGVSRDTARKLNLPGAVLIGRRIRYSAEAVDRFIVEGTPRETASGQAR